MGDKKKWLAIYRRSPSYGSEMSRTPVLNPSGCALEIASMLCRCSTGERISFRHPFKRGFFAIDFEFFGSSIEFRDLRWLALSLSITPPSGQKPSDARRSGSFEVRRSHHYVVTKKG